MALILKFVDVPCCYHSNETTLMEVLCVILILDFTEGKLNFFVNFFPWHFHPIFSLCHIVIYIKKYMCFSLMGAEMA